MVFACASPRPALLSRARRSHDARVWDTGLGARVPHIDANAGTPLLLHPQRHLALAPALGAAGLEAAPWSGSDSQVCGLCNCGAPVARALADDGAWYHPRPNWPLWLAAVMTIAIVIVSHNSGPILARAAFAA